MSQPASLPKPIQAPQPATGVSVLMTVFNAGVYLPPAIDSIFNQTFQDIEFVIVNDGSTDGTAEYLDSLTDPRVRVFHEPNRGTAGATNFGLPHCTKKYIARRDADDLSVLTRLAEQFLFMEANPDVALVGTQVQVIGESESGMTIPLPTRHKEIYGSLIDLNHGMCHGSCMFRNDLSEGRTSGLNFV